MNADSNDVNQVKYNEPGRQRDNGSGPIRLGKTIALREDLYSYIFATSFHPEYVYKGEAEEEEICKPLNRL